MRIHFTYLAAPVLTALSITAAQSPNSANDRLLAAILQGDYAAMRSSLAAGADPNTKDAKGTPALMHAVIFADLQALRLLLDKGADPNATNAAQATALIYAAGDRAKTNLLLDRGANPNVTSALGRTPLLAAAPLSNNGATVARILRRGADPKATDNLAGMPVIMTGGGKAPAVVEAAKARDGVALAHLLANGADVSARDNNGGTALTEAVILQNVENVRMLLAKGADVEAKVSALQFRPLMLAAIRRDATLVEMLLKRGADVHATDANGSTALLWAAYGAEDSSAKVVKLLLDAGANPAATNKRGESALTWARWHGATAAAKLLAAKMGVPLGVPLAEENKGIRALASAVGHSAANTVGPLQQEALRSAIQAAIPALQKTGPIAVKNSSCVSCHSQSFPAMTMAMAKERGFAVDQAMMHAQRKMVLGMLRPATEVLLEGSDVVPQLPLSAGMLLMGLAAEKQPPELLTAAMVHATANRQQADGSWVGWSLRPPMSGGDLRETAYAAHALDLYAPAGRRAEIDGRLAAARTWLLRAKAASPEEEIVRLLGLAWTHASLQELRVAGVKVLALQQPDGGWRQLETRQSDAYATGEALVALVEAGVLRPTDHAFQRGIRFLLQTQQADGTWHVATRAYPFQPLNDSGFPHGRDQWISATATSWATMALLHAVDRPAAVIDTTSIGAGSNETTQN